MPETTEDVLTTIVTLFTAAGSLNIPALKMRVNRQQEAGNAIFYGDTNGELFVLNEREELSVTQTYMDEVAGRTPVVAYIGEIFTHEMIRLGQRIEKLGVDTVSVVTLYFIPLKQEELIAYYSTTADTLSIPMFLYNIPARTGSTIQPETARALALHPNIIGIKDSTGSNESLKGFLDAVRDIGGFNVLNGPDSLIHKGFIEGCSAYISRLANVAPREINAVWSHFHADDIEGFYEEQESVTDPCTDLYRVVFSPAVMKRALQLMGHDTGDNRYTVSSTPEQVSEVQQIIRHYNTN